MTVAYIGVGSNTDPEENIPEALRLLREHVKITAISTFFLTDPIGRPDDQKYYNGVVRIETDADPAALKSGILRRIEDALGRKRTADRYASRTIDLDILLYGEMVIDVNGIVIPDPAIWSRPFISIPLFELAPELLLPGTADTIKEIAGRADPGSLKPLNEFTSVLKRRRGNEL